MSAELRALVNTTARPTGSTRTVPVHVRCAGGHDTGARLRLELDGDGLRLARRKGEVFTAVDNEVAEELADHEPDAEPPLRVECLTCKEVGQGVAVWRLLEYVEQALKLWVVRGLEKQRPPRFVWPGA
ncbi:hypothetical protein ACTXPX_05935 [Glutamicibacter arilaitensis]|uniref:hypothetical protein n=1 Tax=Glutamicibacter arilaitensis TaxID=256701 RepID=UPI00186604E1|nr:hypothetical protein [Glutamicibacter arilaitensis]